MLRHLFLGCILLTGMIIPQEGAASNRAGAVKLLETAGGRAKFVIFLESRPGYSLGPVSGNRVLLTLYDTEKTPLLDRKVSSAKGSFKMEEDRDASLLRFFIPLKSPLREIRSQWLTEKNLFFLSMEGTNGKGLREKTGKRPANIIKNIRFGVQEAFTRIVMVLNQSPSWEMIRRKDPFVTLKLGAIRKIPKRKKYGPMKRLKRVLVKRVDQGADMGIELNTRQDHVRLFWLKDLNRFVMDLYDKPGNMNDSSLLLTAGLDDQDQEKTRPGDPGDPIKARAEAPDRVGAGEKPKERSGPPVQAGLDAQTKQKESVITPFKKADKSQGGERPDLEKKGEEGAKEEQKNSPDPEENFIVRKKIPKRAENKSASKKIHSTPVGAPLRIDPTIEVKLKNARPDNAMINEWTANLNSGEALLFGRIQEAWELKDYEKGAALIDRFLITYPESGLCERISFLRGDFRLYLLKSGRKDVLPALTQSYREAIDRYGRSKNVPGAYIKIAQANFLVGNYYAAIGALDMVISKYPDGDHLPKAYLTRGKAYLRMNQPDKGIENFKTVLNKFPESAFMNDARFWIATYFHNKGVYDEAERGLKGISDSEPEFYSEHPEYLFLRARNYFYQKKYEPARQYFLRALNIGHQPEPGDLLLSRIGDTYHHQEQKEDAKKYYNAAIDHYPDSEGASIAKLRLAKYSSGVSKFKEVHEKNVNKPIGDLALLEMANQYYEKGQYLMALENVKKLVLKPTHGDIQIEAKNLYFRASEKEIKKHYEDGDYEGLIRFFETAQPTLKKDIDREALTLVAQSHYKRDQYTEAISLYSIVKPIDLKRGVRGGYLIDFAQTHIAQGDDEAAERLLEENKKGDIEARHSQKMTILLAEINRRKGDLKRALHQYRSLVTIKSALSENEIAKIYLAMGEISNLENRHEDARESLNRSVALAERGKGSKECLQRALAALGNSYFFEKRHDQASGYYQKSFDQGYGPGSPGYWDTKFRQALSFIGLGQNEKAEQILRVISEEGDPHLQQEVQIKLGGLGLENQLKKLPIWQNVKGTI